jgi:hypothetical protein
MDRVFTAVNHEIQKNLVEQKEGVAVEFYRTPKCVLQMVGCTC